jgi:hypothetical protein
MKKSIMGSRTPTRMTVSPAAVSVPGWCAGADDASVEVGGGVEEGAVELGTVELGAVGSAAGGMYLDWPII